MTIPYRPPSNRMMVPVDTEYRFDDIVVDAAAFRATRNGTDLPLEPKAFRVLLHLIENRQRAVGKNELLATVWKDTFVSEHVLTRAVAQIRKAFGDNSKQSRYIETIPTVGYRFAAVLTPHPSEKPQESAPRRDPRKLLWIAAAAAAVAGLFAIVRSPQVLGVNTHPQVAQFTAADGLEAWPALSPDGKLVAYASDKGGSFQIYVRSVEAPIRETRLTAEGDAIQPAWSPDGARIAYYSMRNRGIFVVPAAGGAARRLTAFGSQPAWSPDGRTIAFASEQPYSLAAIDFLPIGDSTIWTAPADGGNAAPLTAAGQPAGRHARPKWSPRGEIYFVAYQNLGEASLHRIARTGGSIGKVSSGEQVYLDFVVHPSGRDLYYSAVMPDKTYGLWRMRLDARGDAEPGSLSEVAHYAAEQPRELSISGDGTQLAFALSRASSNLWTVPSTGGVSAPLTNDTVARNSQPRFSPDGRRIAWFVNRAGAGGSIWTMNVDGTGAANVAAITVPDTQPQWTPDGRGVIYSAARNGVTQAWVKTGNGAAPYEKEMHFPGMRRWSRDGSLAVLQRRDPSSNRSRIYRIEKDRGEPAALSPASVSAGFPVLSHDNRWVACQAVRDGTTALAVLPSSGGEWRLFAADAIQDWAYDWSPDSSEISTAAFTAGGWAIEAVAWPSGKRRTIVPSSGLGQFVRNPAWSPDGKTIVFERHETRANVYLLDLR